MMIVGVSWAWVLPRAVKEAADRWHRLLFRYMALRRRIESVAQPVTAIQLWAYLK
jgi:hypothetical protein